MRSNMTRITVEIVNVGSKQTIPTKNGKSYQCIEVAYKKDGKIEGKKLMSFVNPGVFEAIQEYTAGDVITVETEKSAPNAAGQAFWQWVSISAGGTAAPTAAVASSGGGKTQEVQTMIIRQSSLGHAVALLNVRGDKKANANDVIAVAKQFEDFVLGKEPQSAVQDIADLADDIPL